MPGTGPITGEEIIFQNGTIFDGQAFLPPGTCVRVRGGTITAVGSAAEVAPSAGGCGGQGLARVSLVDLHGGTLLPGFIDAHVHPVYAGGQLRRCDLRAGATAADYLAIIDAYATAHPGRWSGSPAAGGRWTPFPAASPAASRWTPSPRPARVPAQPGRARRLGEYRRAAARRDRRLDPRSRRRPDRARCRRQPAGALQEGAANLVSRLLPETTDEDMDAALAAAQEYLLSLGITGWQDAIIGSDPGERDNDARLPAGRPGRAAAGQRGRRAVVGPRPRPGPAP